MPEEINRLVSDRISDLHFCVSKSAVQRLAEEGIRDSVHWVGDVMLDAMLHARPIAYEKSDVLERNGLEKGSYSLVTVHRAGNTDNPERLRKIVLTLNSTGETVVFPAHPRTRKALERINAKFAGNVRLIDPVAYFDMVVLEDNARLIATDSGGVQREAYFLGKPCITLREETEWTETVDVGWNKLVGVEPEVVLPVWKNFKPTGEQPTIFGTGEAGKEIVRIIEKEYQKQALVAA
jgi:UDP-N-acetylglucosamine 2-epimerase